MTSSSLGRSITIRRAVPNLGSAEAADGEMANTYLNLLRIGIPIRILPISTLEFDLRLSPTYPCVPRTAGGCGRTRNEK